MVGSTTQNSIARLEEWILEKEGENLEFKEWKTRLDFDELGKYCCALANEGGGRIILGVTDRRPRRIVGTSACDQPERTRKSLCDELHLNIDFELINHPDGNVVAFHVPSRPFGFPMKWDGRYWMREQDSLEEMSEPRLREIFDECGRDFSAGFCQSATMNDLDPVAIESFRKQWVVKLQRQGDANGASRFANQDAVQLLIDCEAVVDGKITYAALILFGKPEALRRELAQAEVIFEYRSSEASGPAQERREFRSGFLSFHDELWNLIQKRNDQQDFREGLFVHPVPTFSERPVREAVLNAVCHRDYQLAGSTFVVQYPRRIEFHSPGGFPQGITKENILDKQSPRNRRLAEILTRCGLVERSGQGLNLIYEEQIKNGKSFPDWERTDSFQVVLTLQGLVTNPEFVGFVERIGLETQTQFTTRDWIVLSLIERNETIPRSHASCVSKLLDSGLIERTGRSKYILARRYFVISGQKGTYTRKKGLDHAQNLALLLKHIQDNQETGTKFNELCQVLPSHSPMQVKSLLRNLKREGLVHVIGERKSAKWYHGPPKDL